MPAADPVCKPAGTDRHPAASISRSGRPETSGELFAQATGTTGTSTDRGSRPGSRLPALLHQVILGPGITLPLQSPQPEVTERGSAWAGGRKGRLQAGRPGLAATLSTNADTCG